MAVAPGASELTDVGVGPEVRVAIAVPLVAMPLAGGLTGCTFSNVEALGLNTVSVSVTVSPVEAFTGETLKTVPISPTGTPGEASAGLSVADESGNVASVTEASVKVTVPVAEGVKVQLAV